MTPNLVKVDANMFVSTRYLQNAGNNDKVEDRVCLSNPSFCWCEDRQTNYHGNTNINAWGDAYKPLD